ncbi:MAG: hypothetical protein COZ05_12390, partial [Armatimonadetes bacterium CG_4_10_14_3_um_filter_59_10]
MPFCESCGSKLPDRSRFCDSCGNQVSTSVPRVKENALDLTVIVPACIGAMVAIFVGMLLTFIFFAASREIAFSL